MMENGKRRPRRQLTPEEKWEVFLEVTSQEISQADAARKYGVDVSVIVRLRALAKDAALAAFASAKPGRPASAEAVELSENGFVLRYRTEQTDDGLSGKEGTFVICSFWLVSALAIIGEMQRARALMERLVKAASPLGLYAEEYDVDNGRHLGNFPQAFSHLALVEAAARIIVAESLAEEA